MRWAPISTGVYALHTEHTYAAVRRLSKRQWSLLLTAQVDGRPVRHGSVHRTMAEAIAAAHSLLK